MILRASDRALTDLLTRESLRADYLWRELDTVQPNTNREREIIAELDRIDD